MKIVLRMIKGFVIGIFMLVPGASGGTMAIILGIYDELINAVSSFRENIKENGLLLLQYGIAGLLGILLLSGPMLSLITIYRKPVMYLFMGAILGSLLPLYRKATISKMKMSNMAVAFIGAVSGTMMTLLPKDLLVFNGGLDGRAIFLLVAAGFFIAIALVLPGISASYTLLMLGIYDVTLMAIRRFDIAYLAPIAAGALVGTFLTADILSRAMKRHPQFTYMLIIGFMLGSLMEVFPGLPSGIEWLYCSLTFFSGLILILFIGSGMGVKNAELI